MDYLDMLLGLGSYEDPYADMGYEETVRRSRPAQTTIQRVNDRMRQDKYVQDEGDILQRARATHEARMQRANAPDPIDQRMHYEYPQGTTGNISQVVPWQMAGPRTPDTESKIPGRQPRPGPSQQFKEFSQAESNPLTALGTELAARGMGGGQAMAPAPDLSRLMYEQPGVWERIGKASQRAAKASTYEAAQLPPGSAKASYVNPIMWLLQMLGQVGPSPRAAMNLFPAPAQLPDAAARSRELNTTPPAILRLLAQLQGNGRW